jgi:hypothetical protein
MNRRLLWTAALAATLSIAPPATAMDFALLGSYWDTDAAGDAAGGGFVLGFPFNDVVAVELRGTYYEELTDDPLENAFDSDDPVFQEQGIQVLPVEAGLRFSFSDEYRFRPYIGGGASYFLLDSDFGNFSDELGYYAVVGASFGGSDAGSLFVEATWRKATATIELDPEDLDDIDDLDVDETADLDLDGVGVNFGWRWNF